MLSEKKEFDWYSICLLNLRTLIGTCLLNLRILIGTGLLKSVPLVFELAAWNLIEIWLVVMISSILLIVVL